MTEPASAASVIKFNTGAKGGGLGDALPAGTVRFYQRDLRGDPQLIGENSIGHTPMGSKLGLATGLAFDVKVDRKSVVVGKSGSVRVGIGGAVIHKKKKK